MARHLSQYFDANPQLKPILKYDNKQISDQVVLSQRQEDQMKEIFELFDTDGGGTIDYQELTIAMTAMGFQDSSGTKNKKTREILDTIDSDGSHTISLDEFKALMKGELSMIDPLQEIKAIFMALTSMEDSDPGIITINKLRLATQKFNVRLSEEELQVMISQIDFDGNQKVDEDDFTRVMTMSPWF